MDSPHVPLPTPIAGHLALDFANTVGHRGTEAEHDYIAGADALLAWSRQAGTVPDTTVARLQRQLRADPLLAGHVIADARVLRQAVFQLGSALAEPRELPRPALRVVLEGVQRALSHAELVTAPAAPDRAAVAFDGHDPSTALLGPLAWSAFDLLRHGAGHPVRQCPAPDCGWLFLDTTKNGSRRWCSMAVCGGRSKSARFRSRRPKA